jgi:DNA-binding CsgD family transcriptional regulator
MYRPVPNLQQIGEHAAESPGPLLSALARSNAEHEPDQTGPERASLMSSLLQALDGLAQGVALFTEDSLLRYANATAQVILDESDWRQDGGQVNSKQWSERNLWLKALRNTAQKQTRSLLELSSGSDSLFVATMPIVVNGETLILANFGSQSSGKALALQLFANHHRLTHAEIEVLEKLAKGIKPLLIAARQHVALSTINTHLSSIRLKTRCTSVNELLVKLSHLPTLRSAAMPGASVTMFG